MTDSKMKKEDAKRILSDVDQSKMFWLHDGKTLRSLNELSRAFKGMKKEVFEHHVTKDKNDFANWIKDVQQDKELAAMLYKVKSKPTVEKIVHDRISQLTRIIKK